MLKPPARPVDIRSVFDTPRDLVRLALEMLLGYEGMYRATPTRSVTRGSTS